MKKGEIGTYSDIGFMVYLTTCFITLKLLHALSWSWLWIFSPMWLWFLWLVFWTGLIILFKRFSK